MATTIAPKIGAAFIFIAAGATAAELARSVRMPYVILACCAFAMAVLTLFVHLPELIERRSWRLRDSRMAGRGGFSHLRLGALAIFFYVGAEVAIGSMMINFLGQPSMGGLSHEAAAKYVSLYWGGAMVRAVHRVFCAAEDSGASGLWCLLSSVASLLVVTAF